jgi:type 1 glutamine amidotransferase
MTRPHAALLLAIAAAGSAGAQDIPIPKNRARQIEAAVPAKPRVAPRKPRRVLIWNTPAHLLAKDPHKGYCTPYGCHAMKALGTKTGAYEPVAGDDVGVFLPESLKRFDAVILNNACGNWITPSPEAATKLKARGDAQAVEKILRKSILDWVRAGGGVVAYHYAMGANRNWPEFGHLLGGRIAGHPWNEEIGIKVEEPSHPLVAAFGGKGFRLHDETFQYREPFDRAGCRVLMSIDNDVTNMNVKNYRLREDGDFALAWIRTVGKGRVFYTSLGHRTQLYWDPRILQFYLDGIQFATGDLPAPTKPRPADACKPSRAPKPAGKP